MQTTDEQILITLLPLTDAGLIEAHDNAVAAVRKSIGPEPRKEDYIHNELTQAEKRWNRVFRAIIAIGLIATLAVSMARVFTAGRDHYLNTIDSEWQAVVAGFAAFIMAESGLSAVTIAGKRWYAGKKLMQLLLVFAGLICAAIAIMGNIIVANPQFQFDKINIWSWIETLSPPILTYVLIIVNENLIIDDSKRQRETNKQYFMTLQQWRISWNSPQDHPEWSRAYRRAIHRALVNRNRVGRNTEAVQQRRALMAVMSADNWQIIINRELVADDLPIPKDTPQLPPTEHRASANGKYMRLSDLP